MNKKTFEVIAKYISEEHGIKVVISPDVEDGPHIEIDKKTIFLPENIKEDNALSALAVLMHEAAHMKHTSQIPVEQVVDNKTEHFILNAIEDVRIDRKNFRILPNIQEFYRKMYKDHIAKEPGRQEKVLQAPMLTRVLLSTILQNSGFSEFDKDNEARDISCQSGIMWEFDTAISYLNRQDWTGVKESIKKIISMFEQQQEEEKNGNGNQQQPNNGGQPGNGSQGSGQGNNPNNCKGNGNTSQKSGPGNGNGQSQSNGGNNQNNQGNQGQSQQNQPPDCEDPTEFTKSSAMWGKGGGLSGPSAQGFTRVEMQETTRQKFVEALNIKERRTINDGNVLDTSNLLAYFTGEVEELFKEDIIEKKKKSKIIFALDCSGSMTDSLQLTRKCRNKVLVSTVKGITDFLDEIIEAEGMDVGYEICAFDYDFYRLNKDNWEQEYLSHQGGTYIWGAYDEARKILLEDPELDGNKMIILVTDGEVHQSEIQTIKDDIMKDNEDIRVMIVGVGADIAGSFVTKIIGDNNIICEEQAEEVLLGAIQTMLGG